MLKSYRKCENPVNEVWKLFFRVTYLAWRTRGRLAGACCLAVVSEFTAKGGPRLPRILFGAPSWPPLDHCRGVIRGNFCLEMPCDRRRSRPPVAPRLPRAVASHNGPQAEVPDFLRGQFPFACAQFDQLLYQFQLLTNQFVPPFSKMTTRLRPYNPNSPQCHLYIQATPCQGCAVDVPYVPADVSSGSPNNSLTLSCGIPGTNFSALFVASLNWSP